MMATTGAHSNATAATIHDYIIIGGGAAGCTLASRLKQKDSSLDILLIEAGPDCLGHPLTSAPLACFAAHHSNIDWDYTTEPQRHLDGRTTYAAAGKVLSGGTAINYGTWTRGPSVDYDRWAEVVGDYRWSYNALLPYFRKCEHYFEPGHEESHGYTGPMHLVTISKSHPNRRYPLREKLRAAWARVGVETIADGSGGSPLGLAETLENWRDGKRQPASQAYDLSQVHVMTQTMVHRVIVEENEDGRTAKQVQLADGNILRARKEIILSAGVYRTPQVLMLSGIGPEAELTRHGIRTVVNLPEVGRNFRDHLAFYQWWKLLHPEQGLSAGTPLWTDPAYGFGIPNDWIVSERCPEEQIKAALVVDGELLANHPQLNPARCHTETIIAYAPAGVAHAGMDIRPDGTYIASLVDGMQSTSVGSITLRSADPQCAPIIDPNFYATEFDRASIRAGARQVMRVLKDTPEGRQIVEDEQPPNGYPVLHSGSSDEEIDARVRRVGGSAYHGSGSAAMGKVVDTDLRVKGVKGLRVVDASILPVSISAHYQAFVYALAERAADLILA